MLDVSAKYLELVNSNIRPQVKPKIVVTYEVNGVDKTLQWQSENLIDLSYKRGVDPFGRSLPYMELVWKEKLSGSFTEEYYPERFNNNMKYAKVELTFYQNLTFGDNAETEEIEFPIMFLTAKPVVDGKYITWTARDLLYFLDRVQSRSFEAGVLFANPIRVLLADERARFRDNKYGVYIINMTDFYNFDWWQGSPNENTVLFDGDTKSILMNYASVHNHLWDFEKNHLTLQSVLSFLASKQPVFSFKRNILKEEPKTTTEADISSYNFKSYTVDVDEESAYDITSSEPVTIGGGTYYYFSFKELAKPVSANAMFPIISRSTYDNKNTITVAPANVNGIEQTIEGGPSGYAYNEDNPINTYNQESAFIKSRFDLLKRYFSSQNSIVELNSLSNIALETGDVVSYPTNKLEIKYQTDVINGTPVVVPVAQNVLKRAVVTGIELTYNGALHQKTILHEVVYDD